MHKTQRPTKRVVSHVEARDDEIHELDISEEMLDAKQKNKNGLEFEFRFGSKDYEISSRLYYAVMKDVQKHYATEPIREESIIGEYPNHVRMIEIRDKKPIYQVKTTKERIESPNYPYRYALAEERMAKEGELPKMRVDRDGKRIPTIRPISRTHRDRQSFHMDGVQVDFTRATITKRGERPGEHDNTWVEYRIELEVTDAKELDIDTLRDTYLAPILRFVLESPILISTKTLSNLRRSPPFEYNVLDSNFRETNRHGYARLDKPTDLSLFDLRDNGLFGVTRYAVTVKTDGIRKLFYISGDSIYFVGSHGRNWSFSRIYRKEGVLLPMQHTLLDGELLDDYGLDGEGNPVSFYDGNAKFSYWAFDVISYNAMVDDKERLLVTIDMNNTPFMHTNGGVGGAGVEGEVDKGQSRYEIVKEMCNNIKGTRFELHCKEFHRCDTVDTFFSACNTALDGDYPFENDGLIFTPIDLPYINRERGRDGREFDVSYSRKWKPSSKLTIDMVVRDGKLYMQEAGIEVEFTGTKRFPYDGRFSNVYEGREGDEINEGEVVEFAYRETEDEDGTKYKWFVPIRARPDKDRPSVKKAALDVWMLLQVPISESTLRGKSYQLMRKSQNQSKTELISEIPEHSNVLDIGAGQGGDLIKWVDQQLRVVAVEPNENQRKTFMERLVALRMRQKQERVPYRDSDIVLHDFGAQDKRVAKLGPFDAVTMFFVITFFRGTDLDKLLSNLSHVLKDGGKVYLTGFDARRFASYLPGYKDSLEVADGDVKKLKLDYVSDSTEFHIDGDVVRLRLAETYVGSESELQSEYAIDYDELGSKLEKSGFYIEEETFLTEETFLSRDELYYAKATRLLRLTKSASISSTKVVTEEELGLPEAPEVNLIKMGDNIEEGLLPLFEDITVDQRIDFEYLGYPLARIGVEADGNCLIHAACRSLSDTYLGMDRAERRVFVRELRDEMAENLGEELFKDLRSGEVARKYTFGAFKRFLKSKQWLGEEFIDYFERTFDVEIIMLWFTEDHGMVRGRSKPPAKPYSYSIVLLNLGNQHYESVGYYHKDKLWTKFAPTHSLIKVLAERK